jgi:hypothetical protein
VLATARGAAAGPVVDARGGGVGAEPEPEGGVEERHALLEAVEQASARGGSK